MKTLASTQILLLALLFSQPTLGQVQADSVSSHPFAIRFSFEVFRPVGGFGAKYWFNNTQAAGIQITGSFYREQNGSRIASRQQVDVVFDFQYHLTMTNDLSCFIAIDPGFGFSHYEYESPSYTDNEETWRIQIGAGIGVEYWFASNFTISAYQYFNYYRTESIDENRSSINGTIGVSNLMLSFYF